MPAVERKSFMVSLILLAGYTTVWDSDTVCVWSAIERSGMMNEKEKLIVALTSAISVLENLGCAGVFNDIE